MRVISTRRAGTFDDDGIYSEGWEQVITYTDAEMELLQSTYDPSSSTSPSVAMARPIVRELLDAVRPKL